jgi:hypothetical protein
MFDQVAEKIFYVYGALNFAWIPIVWLSWPEVSLILLNIDWILTD